MPMQLKCRRFIQFAAMMTVLPKPALDFRVVHRAVVYPLAPRQSINCLSISFSSYLFFFLEDCNETNRPNSMLSLLRNYLYFLLSLGLFGLSVGFLQSGQYYHPLHPSLESEPHYYYASSSSLLDKKIQGDPIREATGIRPSLHPVTINAIADALKCRAIQKEGMVFPPMSSSSSATPLQIAETAAAIATSAIAKRQESSTEDGMKLTVQEEQTIAGRILGVVMRLDTLEEMLVEKVGKVGWIAKYNEWATFGTVKAENADDAKSVNEKIRDDPLFCLNRAECLLALFLKHVELPGLEKAKHSVPDGSKIDFLDADRLEVLG
eukprot:scaffold73_cov118-Cylindrotheca_fusiformis.AAC.6